MAEDNSVQTSTAPAPQNQKQTFVPLIFGGAVACALGFFGGQIDVIEERLGLAEDNGLAVLVQSQADALKTQAAQIADLTERLAVAEAVELPEIPEVDLSGIESALAEQSAATAALLTRVDEIEKKPMTESVSDDAIAAYEAELQRLFASVETQRGEIEGLIEEARLSETVAAAQAQVATARAAASRIVAALDNGNGFEAALSEVAANGDVAIPDALSAAAASGVATLSTLREEFPEFARAALAADRSGSNGDNVLGFLQKQLGVRSVEPREGSDADAVLSRAEAAVRDGQLAAALDELAGLPETARAAMTDWIALAETRHAAMVAVDEVTSALASN